MHVAEIATPGVTGNGDHVCVGVLANDIHAAAIAAPADQPTRYPVLRATLRAVRSAVSVGTSTTLSGTAGSYSAGVYGVVARCFKPSSPWSGESG
jgi:hypothetical protein